MQIRLGLKYLQLRIVNVGNALEVEERIWGWKRPARAQRQSPNYRVSYGCRFEFRCEHRLPNRQPNLTSGLGLALSERQGSDCV